MIVVILRGRVSIGPFLLGGVFICLFEGCSEDSMYLFFSFFLDTLFLYMRSYDHLLTYIVLFFLFILMYVFLSPTPSPPFPVASDSEDEDASDDADGDASSTDEMST